jgi:hypothetical protein
LLAMHCSWVLAKRFIATASGFLAFLASSAKWPLSKPNGAILLFIYYNIYYLFINICPVNVGILSR